LVIGILSNPFSIHPPKRGKGDQMSAWYNTCNEILFQKSFLFDAHGWNNLGPSIPNS